MFLQKRKGNALILIIGVKEEECMKFKKVVVSLLLCCMLFSLSACGKEKVDVNAEVSKIAGEIDTLYANVDVVSSMNILVWQKAGANDLMSTLSKMLSATDAKWVEKEGKNRYWSSYVADAFGCNSNGYKNIYEYCESYQKATNNVVSAQPTIENEIKELKSKLKKDEDKQKVEKLSSYYVKVSAYADSAINPSGNLINYKSNDQVQKKDIEIIKKEIQML